VIYVLSHELQEQLRTIAGFADLLDHKLSAALDPESRGWIEELVGGCRRQAKRIDDLLIYCRAATQHDGRHISELFGPCSIEAALDDARSAMKRVLEDTGAMIYKADHPWPDVYAADSLIAQVFQNLLSNAVKYRRQTPVIIVSARTVGTQVLISVKDNGIGFAMEQAAKMFQLFSRIHTDRKYSGSGIGLAICRKIVEAHGGSIWAEGEPGVGATVHFTLPSLPA
jgi:signal transduction histidine kinase